MQDLFLLEESFGKDYQPTRDEILEYAVYLGMSPKSDQRYFYIAEEGLKTPIPHPWQPAQDQNGEIVYINAQTKEISQEHPLDSTFRKKYIDAKRKDENEQAPKSRAAMKLQNMIQANRELEYKFSSEEIDEQFNEGLENYQNKLNIQEKELEKQQQQFKEQEQKIQDLKEQGTNHDQIQNLILE